VNMAHAQCFDGDPYPSAKKCQPCHEDHFREWSVSQHAYAQLSPVFNAFSNKLLELTSGTNGDFCIRCHTPVGMSLNECITMSQMDRHPTSREGVTCVVCHRINQPWGKISGRQALVAGDIHQVVYGPLGPEVLQQVIAHPDRYGATKTEPDPARGRDIHRDAIPFFQIVTPGFCGSCHDVFGPDGFRLEDAFSEYKQSPAARCKQQSCQDCHMGTVPGLPSGYATLPAARMGNIHTKPRKHTNHMIVGPDYSIVHPGIFPHHPRAIREEGQPTEDPEAGLATMREWLQFCVEAGWGEDEFENRVPDDYKLPAAWKDSERRYRAREIVNENMDLLAEATYHRHQLLSLGYQLGDVELEKANQKGIKFRIKVSNGTDGHGVPTGFDAERVVFLRVTVTDSQGRVVFISGDLDPNGDVRDHHSAYVHNGEVPRDKYLFSLQSQFIATTLRGPDRNQILAVPVSIDPLPYVRPAFLPYTVYGRPLFTRKHKQNIEVDGCRYGDYEVRGNCLTGQGPYCINVKLIAGMVPINLVREISDVGFDYGMTARQIANRIVGGHMVLHERNAWVELDQ